MKKGTKMKFGALATALVLSYPALVPQAYAHACNSRQTIVVREGKDFGNGHKEYWYFQGGKVCGRFVS